MDNKYEVGYGKPPEEKTEWPDYTQNPPQIKEEETQVLILQAIFAL